MMPWRRHAGRRLQPDAHITTCRRCASEHVIATAWTEQDESWWIHVRCGGCGASREVVVSDAAAQRYDQGMRAIARALNRLERATALDLDLVDAVDFAR